jgi:hypothetical protein
MPATVFDLERRDVIWADGALADHPRLAFRRSGFIESSVSSLSGFSDIDTVTVTSFAIAGYPSVRKGGVSTRHVVLPIVLAR